MPATHHRPNLHLSSLSSTCRLVLLTGGLGLLVASAAAQPDRLLRRFETANEAYAQGRYEQAVEGYRDILDAGYASVALYHNLGNAYVRLDRVGRPSGPMRRDGAFGPMIPVSSTTWSTFANRRDSPKRACRRGASRPS